MLCCAVSCRDPVPVVKPDWVVASLRAGQLLPVRMPFALLCNAALCHALEPGS
jgi:hypothetical protein